MYFNDGEDPWKVEENHIRVFNFDGRNGANTKQDGIISTKYLIIMVMTYVTSLLV